MERAGATTRVGSDFFLPGKVPRDYLKSPQKKKGKRLIQGREGSLVKMQISFSGVPISLW